MGSFESLAFIFPWPVWVEGEGTRRAKGRAGFFSAFIFWNPRPKIPAAGTGDLVWPDGFGAIQPGHPQGRRPPGPEAIPQAMQPSLGLVPISAALSVGGWPLPGSRWGSPPSLCASAVSRVCDGKSCSDSERNPPSLAFLTHFLILLAILQPGTGAGANGPELAPTSVPRPPSDLGRTAGPSELLFPHW